MYLLTSPPTYLKQFLKLSARLSPGLYSSVTPNKIELTAFILDGCFSSVDKTLADEGSLRCALLKDRMNRLNWNIDKKKAEVVSSGRLWSPGRFR